MFLPKPETDDLCRSCNLSCYTIPLTVRIVISEIGNGASMKAMTLQLPDHLYEQLIMEAAAAQKSPEQWIMDRLFTESRLSGAMTEPHTLLVAALEAPGFRRLEPQKA
jgi:hypothetical protein